MPSTLISPTERVHISHDRGCSSECDKSSCHPVPVNAWQILIGNIVRQITDRGELVGEGEEDTRLLSSGEVPRGHLGYQPDLRSSRPMSELIII